MLIDISDELFQHYALVKKCAEAAVNNADASEAGKSTLLNSVTTILKELSKIQVDLHNSSSIAQLQAAIVDALETYSPELKNRVLNLLEARLEQLG